MCVTYFCSWILKITTRKWTRFLLFSCQAMSNSSGPHGLQYTRLPCASPSPRFCQSSCALKRWWTGLIKKERKKERKFTVPTPDFSLNTNSNPLMCDTSSPSFDVMKLKLCFLFSSYLLLQPGPSEAHFYILRGKHLLHFLRNHFKTVPRIASHSVSKMMTI